MGSNALAAPLQRTFALFDAGEPQTAREVAECLDIDQQRATSRLRRLVEQDWLETKTMGTNGRVWWRPPRDGSPQQRSERTDSEQFASLVEAVEEYAIFTLDTEGYIQTWNPGAERIKGYSAEQAVDEHFSIFYTEEDRDAGVPERNLSNAIEHGSTEDEGWRVRADGSQFWANVTITAIRDDDGELEGFAKVTRDMTERREQEETLRQQRDFIRGILDTAPIGVLTVNPDGTFTTANHRARELLELDSTDEETTVGINDVYDEDGNYIPPEDRPYVRAFETGESFRNWHSQVPRADGGRRWISANIEPMVDDNGHVERILVTLEDVTQSKAQTNRLERQRDSLERELNEIFTRIDDAFIALDEDWRITYANDQAAEMVHLSPGELIGAVVWDVLPEVADGTPREQAAYAMETQESVQFEYYSDLLEIWLEVRGYPSESGLSVYFRDITERKEYERRLEESHERLEQFASAVTHDLREPLGAVSSYLQLLERRYEDELDEDAEEFIQFAVGGASRMREMLDGLVTAYGPVDTDRDGFEPVELDAVVDDVLVDLETKIEENDAEITTDALPTVEGDRGQLYHLVLNLIDNAIKYAGDEPPRIHVTAEQSDGIWAISVRDEGIGMAPEATEGIFEVFQRLHPDEEYPGTGIGLALCKRIVERHGGEIWVDSAPGAGSTFTFTVPASDDR